MPNLQTYQPMVGRLLTPAILPVTKYWIIAIVTLVLVSPTDISLSSRLAVLILYSMFYAYPLVHRGSARKSGDHIINYQGPRAPILVAIIIVQFLGISISAQFYTGSTISTAITNAISGANAYAGYQNHFASQGIASVPAYYKAGYILLLAISKIGFVFLIANFFLSNSRTATAFFAMAISSILYLSFGLARGTFFEVFELASAYLYFWSITSSRKNSSGRRRKSIMFRTTMIISPFVLISLFIANAIRRYDNSASFFSQCSPNFCFTSWNLPFSIEYPIYLLTVYFGNGAYFMARLYEATVFYAELAYLIPMQSVFDNNSTEFGVRDMMCGKYFECEFVWTPEMATVISIFGLLSFFVINIIFYISAKLEQGVFKKPNMAAFMLMYFVFLFLLSLPVANFYFVSSSSIVATVLLAGLWMLTRLRATMSVGATSFP